MSDLRPYVERMDEIVREFAGRAASTSTTKGKPVSKVRCDDGGYHAWHLHSRWFRLYRVCVLCGARHRL